MLSRDPARRKRLEAEWIGVMSLIAAYSTGKLKVFEVHHLIEYARKGFFTAILDHGVPDNVAWIYAMHAIGVPAAPPPGRKGKL